VYEHVIDYSDSYSDDGGGDDDDDDISHGVIIVCCHIMGVSVIYIWLVGVTSTR